MHVCMLIFWRHACFFFFFEFAVHPSVGLRYNVQLINTVHTCTNVNSHTMVRPVGRNFQRGVRRLALLIAHLAVGGLGAPQGSQKPWGIWSKILQSSNFQALYSNFPKVLFFKTDF